MFIQQQQWPDTSVLPEIYVCGLLLCLQDEQRAERRAAKDASAALSVVDKSTFASRQQALFTDTIKAGFREVMRADVQVGWCKCWADACSAAAW